MTESEALQGVAEFFQRLALDDARFVPLRDLVGEIMDVKELKSLHPWTAMHDLCISQVAFADPHGSPYLRIRLVSERELEFRYVDTAIDARQWCRVESPENALRRLLSFVEQLNWFGRRVLG